MIKNVSKKGFSSIPVLLIISFLIACLAAVYFWYQNQQLQQKSSNPNQVSNQQTPSVTLTPSLPPDETASWKTYTDTKYRFSLKYPNSWEFKSCPDDLCGTLIDNNSEVIRFDGFSNSCEVNLVPSQANAEKVAECYCLASVPGANVSCDTPSEEKAITNISGITSYNFRLNELKNNNFQRKRGPFTVIYFPKPVLNSGLLYEYGLYFEVLDANKAPVFDQILSTVKFLDQTSVSQTRTAPVVVFDPSGLFSPSLKEQMQQRIINPYLDYSDNGQNTVSITIAVNNIASTKDKYPYTMQAIGENGATFGMAISLTNGNVNYWTPECMGPCNFSESFKAKYPEIVKLVGP